MTAYDSLIQTALRELSERLAQDDVAPEQAATLVDLVRMASFPGLLGLLGSQGTPVGEMGQGMLHEAARRAAERPEIAALGVTTDDVERLLTTIFVHGRSPESLLQDSGLRNRLLQAGLQELAGRVGMALTPEQAMEAVRLLSTGDFFGDVEATTAAVVFAVRGMPLALLDDVRALPHRLFALLAALVADLTGTPFVATVVLTDLTTDGKLDHPPKVLPRTLHALFSFAGVHSTAKTIAELIRPENRSVRLAIVVYARAHGIPLQEQDLDTVRVHLLDTDEPDLGPLLSAALSRYIEAGQAGRLVDILGPMGAAQI